MHFLTLKDFEAEQPIVYDKILDIVYDISKNVTIRFLGNEPDRKFAMVANYDMNPSFFDPFSSLKVPEYLEDCESKLQEDLWIKRYTYGNYRSDFDEMIHESKYYTKSMMDVDMYLSDFYDPEEIFREMTAMKIGLRNVYDVNDVNELNSTLGGQLIVARDNVFSWCYSLPPCDQEQVILDVLYVNIPCLRYLSISCVETFCCASQQDLFCCGIEEYLTVPDRPTYIIHYDNRYTTIKMVIDCICYFYDRGLQAVKVSDSVDHLTVVASVPEGKLFTVTDVISITVPFKLFDPTTFYHFYSIFDNISKEPCQGFSYKEPEVQLIIDVIHFMLYGITAYPSRLFGKTYAQTHKMSFKNSAPLIMAFDEYTGIDPEGRVPIENRNSFYEAIVSSMLSSNDIASDEHQVPEFGFEDITNDGSVLFKDVEESWGNGFSSALGVPSESPCMITHDESASSFATTVYHASKSYVAADSSSFNSAYQFESLEKDAYGTTVYIPDMSLVSSSCSPRPDSVSGKIISQDNQQDIFNMVLPASTHDTMLSNDSLFVNISMLSDNFVPCRDTAVGIHSLTLSDVRSIQDIQVEGAPRGAIDITLPEYSTVCVHNEAVYEDICDTDLLVCSQQEYEKSVQNPIILCVPRSSSSDHLFEVHNSKPDLSKGIFCGLLDTFAMNRTPYHPVQKPIQKKPLSSINYMDLSFPSPAPICRTHFQRLVAEDPTILYYIPSKSVGSMKFEEVKKPLVHYKRTTMATTQIQSCVSSLNKDTQSFINPNSDSLYSQGYGSVIIHNDTIGLITNDDVLYTNNQMNNFPVDFSSESVPSSPLENYSSPGNSPYDSPISYVEPVQISNPELRFERMKAKFSFIHNTRACSSKVTEIPDQNSILEE